MATIYVDDAPVAINVDTTVAELKESFDHRDSEIAACWSNDGALLLKDYDRLLDYIATGDELAFQRVEPGDGLFSQ